MVSKFQKVINFLYKRFVQEMGREPATPKEIMDIQNEAVQYFNKTKGVPLTSKKPAFQGFTPKVIEGGKSKEGIGTLFKDSPEAIAKIKADNKAAVESLKKKKIKSKEPESLFATEKEFARELDSIQRNIIKNDPAFNLQIAESYLKPGNKTYAPFPDEEPGKLLSPKQRQEVLDNIRDVMKNDEYERSVREDFDFSEITDDMFKIKKASGGIARLGYAGGAIVKGGNWFLKALRDTRKLMIQNKQHSPEQLKYYLNQIDDQIKKIEAGGQIPEEVIQTIRKDPIFKSVSQTRAQDPDLREIEEVLLEYGEKHALGGRAGSGLNYLLGEDDQNVRMPSPGGVPGLLGE